MNKRRCAYSKRKRAPSRGPFALSGLAVLVLLTLSGCSNEAADSTGSAEPARAVLTGTVTYRERTPMRLDAVIKVRLSDISLADAPAMILAEQLIPAKGKAVPIDWSLEYDPSKIDERYTYAVRAEIRDGRNTLLWTTTTVHPVLTRGAPANNVEIMVEQVAD